MIGVPTVGRTAILTQVDELQRIRAERTTDVDESWGLEEEVSLPILFGSHHFQIANEPHRRVMAV
jgi:hypothetical protein